MSQCVCDNYIALSRGADNNFNTVKFPGLRWELSRKLVDEFVAPIERNDIYNLCCCLDKEMWQIGKIQRISHKFYPPEKQQFISLLSTQTKLMAEICDLKHYSLYLEEIKSCRNNIRDLKIQLLKAINSSLQNNSKALLSYVYMSYNLEFAELIGNTFTETEGVILNNT